MKKGAAAALLLAVGLRLALYAGLGDELEGWLKNSDGRMISASLNIELGAPETEVNTENEQEMGAEYIPSVLSAPAEDSVQNNPTADTEALPEETAPPEPVTPDNGAEVCPTTDIGPEIDNDTSFEIDVGSLMSQGLSQKLIKDQPQILIIHTHGSEAYKPDGADQYTETDPSRTDDTNYNVVRIGDELAAGLESYGLNVLHDRELYDYPSYTGSYTRSGEAVERYLSEYPTIAVVIDVHRDAIGSGDVIYKTVADLQGKSSSQVMLLVGTGENGLPHPYWQENLKLALAMQQAVNKKYPTLARPLEIKPERYNQQLTKGSMILEVGSNGNTLREALCAAALFADAVGPMLAGLVE